MKRLISGFMHSFFFSLFLLKIVFILALAGCSGNEDHNEPAKKEEKPEAAATKAPAAPEPTIRIISTYPEDGSFIRELDHPIYIEFSETVKERDFVFTITPDPGKYRVEWQEDDNVVVDHENLFVPGTSYRIGVSVSGSLLGTFSFTASGLSSLQLIEEAEKAGSLDRDSAWTYRLQTIFEPHRLPLAYQSDSPIKDADGVIRNFFRVKDQLNEETLQELQPYLVRPTHPDSIFYDDMSQSEEDEPQSFMGNWPTSAVASARPLMAEKATCVTTENLLLWAPKRYESVLKDATFYIDKNDIYRKFKKLMGRDLLDDYKDLFQNEGPTDRAKNGGDGRVDIYMVSGAVASRGQFGGICIPTAWEPGGETNRKSSAYILIDRTTKGKRLGATLAHEIFHAFQYAFDALDDDWWYEATANWSEDYINSYWDFEQEDIEHSFNRRKNRLKSLTLVDDNHEYGIYIYPYFLSKEYGDEIIGSTWKECETVSSLDALDKAVPDGFDESLKRFILPTLDYGKYEGDIRKPEEKGMALFKYHKFKNIEIKTPDKALSEQITTLPLGGAYVLVKNKLKSTENVPMIRFDLKPFVNNDDLTIQAVFNPKGEARYEDWTGREERELCQNDSEEKFEELAILVTNKNREDVALVLAHGNPEKHNVKTELNIEFDTEGCTEVDGTAVVTADLQEDTHTKWEHRWPGGGVDRTQTDLQGSGRAAVRIKFEKKDSSYDEATKTVTQYYDITDSSVTSFNVRGKSYYFSSSYDPDRGCTCTKKQTTIPIGRNFDLDDSGGLSITFDAETGKAKYVALPAIVVYHDVEEKTEVVYEGCCGSEGGKSTQTLSHIPFVVGSVKAKDSEELARVAKTEIAQMERIAMDSKKMAEDIMKSMPQLMNMNDEQAEDFYKKLDKKVEDFEKQHDIEKMAQGLEKKMIPEDLVVTKGDGIRSIGGGGERVDNKKIENGTSNRRYQLTWNISLKKKKSE